MIKLVSKQTGELEKAIGQKLKTAGAAALIGLGAALPSSSAQAPMPTPAQRAVVAQKDDFGTKPEDRFLWSIMQVESSGGKNTRHKKMKTGMHAGDHAMGRWGLMPKTVKDIVSRVSAAGKADDSMKHLSSLDNTQMDKFFKENPTVELSLARLLARHVMRRQSYNNAKAAYAWLHGHNLHGNEIPSEDVHAEPYVQKFMRANKFNPIRPVKTAPVMAKTDGYTFRERFHDWKTRRDAIAREPGPKDRTFSFDPGRRRDDDDEKDAQVKRDETADLRGRIKGKIRDASDNYGGGKSR